MRTQVENLGNSQEMRLPPEKLNSTEFTLVKPFRHKTLEERTAKFEGKLMLDGEYDWGNLSEERYSTDILDNIT